MLGTLKAHFGKSKTNLEQNFHRDLNWFRKFLPQFNGTAFFNHSPVQMTIELDACLVGHLHEPGLCHKNSKKL